MTDQADSGDPIWISMDAFLAQEVSPAGVTLTIDIISSVYLPTQQAFEFDPEALARRLASRDQSGEDLGGLLVKHRDELSVFFTVLLDGRWVPSPIFFSVNDSNAEVGNYQVFDRLARRFQKSPGKAYIKAK